MYRRGLFWSGVALVLAGGVVGLRIPYFYVHNQVVAKGLMKQAQALVSSSQTEAQPAATSGSVTGTGKTSNAGELAPSTNTAGTEKAVQNAADVAMTSTIPLAHPRTGDVLGIVVIPKLDLRAPVLEGTGATVLNVGVGHLSSSAMFGEPSVAVLAAHNATWFRHIDRLVSGDTIQVQTASGTYTYKVARHQVVKTGAAVMQTAAPVLLLESCYPLNALYVTPYRYLVRANLVQTQTIPSGQQGTGQAGRQTSDPITPYDVTASVPKDLADEGLLVHQNNVPLGHLTYTASTAAAFTQSAAPLAVTNAMTQLFNAYVHASGDSNAADLEALVSSAPSAAVTQDNPLFGVAGNDLVYQQPLELNIQVTGTKLEGVTGTVGIAINGKLWRMTLKATAVDGPVSEDRVSRAELKLTTVSFR